MKHPLYTMLKYTSDRVLVPRRALRVSDHMVCRVTDFAFGRPLVCLLVAFAVAFFSLSGAVPAQARMGQAIWMDELPEGVEFDIQPLMSRDEARMAAFGRAVLEEAVEMVPGELSEARVVLLGDYLKPRASEYVLSYSVVSVEDLEQGKRLTVDVAVNRTALKKALKRLGIWFTVGEPVSYNPLYGNMPAEIWEELGRMHVLYGLTPNSSAPVSLQMELVGEEWRMVLTKTAEGASPVTVAESSAATFGDAWHAVWGRYFAGVSATQTSGPAIVLSVEGWFAPDGVESFDRTLQSWEGVLDEASLMNVTLKPAGVSAKWSLVVVSRQALESKLSNALANRGLAYELSDAVDEAVAE